MRRVCQSHGDEHRPVCRTCKKAVMCKGGNTTNLLVHLRDAHPDLHKDAIHGKTDTSKGTQSTLTTIIENGRLYDPKSLPAKELNLVVAYYIVKDMQPYSIVENPGFRALVSKLNPRYKLPSQKYFTQHKIPSLYTSVKESTVAQASRNRVFRCNNGFVDQ